MATYYFDGSDAAATDPNNVWTNDSNAFNGDITTAATTTTAGSTNFLKAEGTNAPSSSSVINGVVARFYGGRSGAGDIITVEIYTDGLAETLYSQTKGSGASYSSFVLLTPPAAGWTWATIQALETKIWCSTLTSMGATISSIEIQVDTDLLPSTLYRKQGFQ